MLQRVLAPALSFLVSRLRPAGVESPVLAMGELRVDASGHQHPFNAASKDGALMGLEADLVRTPAEAMNWNLSWTSMPFPDLLPALKEGHVDMVLSGISTTPGRTR